MANRDDFYSVLTRAIKDITEHGYDNPARIAEWMRLIQAAAEASMMPLFKMQEILNQTLGQIYRKQIDQGKILERHPGIERFTLDKVRPQLRAELDRRILASANLIRLNREEAIQKTLRRFEGWSTSIPAGGTKAANRAEVKTDIRKALAQLPFAERRVAIDQGHKFIAALNETLAVNSGALAVRWHSRWKVPGYNYREDHKERDGHVYVIKGNWAVERGLMKAGADGYYDNITHVGEEPFCQCSAVYVYNLGDLPDDLLTKKGREALATVRAA